MQSESQPIRPPRLTRTSSKESSGGLLMSVIRSLTSSRDSTDRDREKANLEQEFRECDSKLSSLVVSHHQELSQVMSAFSKISQKLRQSRERVVVTRDKLSTCMKLLHCKRDELKKLWLESVENKVVLELLDRVETIMIVPQNIDNYITKKHYLHATKLLVNSLSQLETDLANVDALKEVKSELIAKKESLYDVIIDEIHKHLYIRSTADVIKKFKRHGSVRHTSETPARKMSVADILSPALMQTSINKKRSTNTMTTIGVTIDESIEEDPNISDPEEDSKHFISILIKCLTLLNKIPDAVEAIKEKCDKELANIVKRTGRELVSDSTQPSDWTLHNKGNSGIPLILNSSLVLGNSENNQINSSHVLQDFLDLLFQQYRSVVHLHDSVVLTNLRRIVSNETFSIEYISLYSIPDIWSKVQTILQFVADVYLDISGTHSSVKTLTNTADNTTGGLVTTNPTVSDLSIYFAKRKGMSASVNTLKMKKLPLFRFDCSSHAMSLNAFLAEQKEALKEKSERGETQIDSIDLSIGDSEQYMVCNSALENIVLIFNPMMKFIGEIEEELELEEGNHCPLYSYIISCAKLFCNQVNAELERMMDLANKSLDIWKVSADPEVLSSLGLSRPILHSTLMIDRGIHDLKNLMFSLPLYADDFLTFICNVLSNYKETCLAAYRGIVQPEPEDKRIISATWAKDEDINRFLKSLPNWATLLGAQNEKLQHKQHIKLQHQETRMTFDESPEEVRLRNMRESEILTSNLAQETLIPNHEILSDVAQLRILAQLQESMEWIGKRVDDLVNSLPQSSDGSFLAPSVTESKSNYELMPLSDVSIATLNQLSSDFEELAETCLLVLHLEVRVHCFYFLLPVAQSSFAMGIDSQEPDSEVIRFNKDLSAIDEAMGVVLQPWKLRYIFEGVGHLVATILINCVNTIKRINSNGVKKMCRNIFAIQQSLTTITMSREVALDYARQYFELFYHTPEEILTTIIEKGPQFQMNEYISAITLLHRSIAGREQHLLDSVLNRLMEILNEVAVSL